MVTVTTKQRRRMISLCFILLPSSLSVCLNLFSDGLLSFGLPATKLKFQANIEYTCVVKHCVVEKRKERKPNRVMFIFSETVSFGHG